MAGVDLGSGFIKVAELDYSRRQPVLTAAGAIAVPQGAIRDGLISDSSVIVAQLQQLMLSAGCCSKNVVFSVGSRSAVVREAVFPLMAPAELKEAITWEIEKYIPFAPDSYYYDYSIAGKSETGLEMRVVIAAAAKEAIDALMALAKESGLNPVAVDIDALAAGRALSNPDSALLVDIGDLNTQITVFKGGCPAAARTAAIGGRNFTLDIMQVLDLTYQEAELLKMRQTGLLRPCNADDATDVHYKLAASIGELEREIIQTSELYKAQNRSAVIDKVILAGGGANLNNLSQYLEWLTGMPVALLNPLFSVHSTAALDPQYIQGLAGQLTVAIGLAMRGGEA
jgi:type IV pilus assembly protein PilM